MSRRKSFLLFAVTLVATAGAAFYLLHDTTSFAPIIEDMQTRLEPGEEAPPADKTIGGLRQVSLEFRAIGLNRDQVGMPLIDSHGGRATLGIVKDLRRMLTLAQSAPGAHIMQWPRVTTGNGNTFSLSTGPAITLMTPNGPIMKRCGIDMRGTPTICKDGRIHLPLSITMTEPKTANPTTDADFEVCKVEGVLILKEDQTGFLGGITRKYLETQDVPVPFLGSVPLIGDWFHYTQAVEYEQEILITITPKIIHGIGP